MMLCDTVHLFRSDTDISLSSFGDKITYLNSDHKFLGSTQRQKGGNSACYIFGTSILTCQDILQEKRDYLLGEKLKVKREK